jgi:hypothetical protein
MLLLVGERRILERQSFRLGIGRRLLGMIELTWQHNFALSVTLRP